MKILDRIRCSLYSWTQFQNWAGTEGLKSNSASTIWKTTFNPFKLLSSSSKLKQKKQVILQKKQFLWHLLNSMLLPCSLAFGTIFKTHFKPKLMNWSEGDKPSQTGSSSSHRPHLWLSSILPFYLQVFWSFCWQQNKPVPVKLSAGHRGRSKPEVEIFCFALPSCLLVLILIAEKKHPLWWWLFPEANKCQRFFAFFKNGTSLIAEHDTINPWACSLNMHLLVPFPASRKAVRGLWPERLLNRKILLNWTICSARGETKHSEQRGKVPWRQRQEITADGFQLKKVISVLWTPH